MPESALRFAGVSKNFGGARALRDVTFEVAPAPDEGGLDAQGIARAVEFALERGGRTGAHVSVVVVDEPTLSAIHARSHGDPSPTDVISFDYGADGVGPDIEVLFSLERARDVARAHAVPLAREMALYVVHGVLHACGLDDGNAAQRRAMRAVESEVLLKLGFTADLAAHEWPPERDAAR